MPNLKKHVTVGAAVGGGVNLTWQLYKLQGSPNPPKDLWETLRRIDFVEIALCALIGAGFAALPDMIEPATTPNHRAFFHSFATLGGVAYGAFGKHTEKLLPKDRHALRVAALSYMSHLFLDGQTPKGLPAIGLPIVIS
jgi:membrane-bound metal-dependent hydrolase YbcI (DUF457 family)